MVVVVVVKNTEKTSKKDFDVALHKGLPERGFKVEATSALRRGEDGDELKGQRQAGLALRPAAATTLAAKVLHTKRTADSGMLLRRIKDGLKADVVDALGEAFGVTQKVMSTVLHIPGTTLARRKKEGRFSVVESDRIYRLTRLMDLGVEMMNGDKRAAREWFGRPLEVLGGSSPLEHASTEVGAREVEDLIGRIRHGVFS